jgi:hypothetical protein
VRGGGPTFSRTAPSSDPEDIEYRIPAALNSRSIPASKHVSAALIWPE